MIPLELYPPPRLSWKQVAAKLPVEQQEKLLQMLGNDEEAGLLEGDFFFNARREQLPPLEKWVIWLILAGRGFGKNFAGANWLIEEHRTKGVEISAIVAATAADLRRYCVEGPSGIINQAPLDFRPRYVPSKTRLEWPNGTVTHLYTSEKPDRLRGANHQVAWGDEFCSWAYPTETWDQLMFTLRYSKEIRCMITTTPRPIPELKELLKREGDDVVVTRGATYDNATNLSPIFIEQLKKRYEGTSLGRQEIMGEVLMDAEGALWNHDMLDGLHGTLPSQGTLTRRAVAVDPAITATKHSDETGIVVGAIDEDKHAYVEGDYSGIYTPDGWARKAIWAYYHHKANLIVAEKNQGGLMVSTIINDRDSTIKVKLVHASIGKVARAEPIAAQYEKGMVTHVGTFAKLEDEMCAFVPGDLKWSPNRVDALVWLLTELVVGIGGRAGTWGRSSITPGHSPYLIHPASVAKEPGVGFTLRTF